MLSFLHSNLIFSHVINPFLVDFGGGYFVNGVSPVRPYPISQAHFIHKIVNLGAKIADILIDSAISHGQGPGTHRDRPHFGRDMAAIFLCISDEVKTLTDDAFLPRTPGDLRDNIVLLIELNILLQVL